MKVVREVVIASKHLGSGIDLRIIPSIRSLYCSIDQQQLKEVIENILINAVESLENDSGTIEITFGIEYFTRNDFPIFFQENDLPNGWYSFCQIKDTGQGVRAEDQSKVFEPFYTTKFFGRGLGLALSVGIMQTHKGALIFDSGLGRGTTVKILLPTLESSAQQAVIPGDADGPVTKLSGNILLVDDDAIVLEVGKEILTSLGFTVATAVNGREAVEKVNSRDINYCAIVMDISMPEMDGIEAMQSIRKIDPTIPILLSSGYSEGDFIFNKDQGGQPDGFLPKPYNISDLQSNIEKMLSSC
jgi:CheY-like chemotaxis protein